MKYLAAFTSSAGLEGFRRPEFLSVAAALGVPVTLLDDDIPWVSQGGDAFWFSVFESGATLDQLRRLAQRCMLLRGIYLLFETAATLEDLYACLDGRSVVASRRYRGVGSAAPQQLLQLLLPGGDDW